MEQQDLFHIGRDPEVVRKESQDAIQQVEDNAEDDWKDLALEAVHVTCMQRESFISDDVWVCGDLPSTREDRALGPVLMKAAKLKWCEKTDRVRPSLRSHMSGKPVWKSLIWRAINT
jgi:hypothetical protein